MLEDVLITELLGTARECIAEEFDLEEALNLVRDEILLTVVIQQVD